MAQAVRPTYADPAYNVRLSQAMGSIAAGAASTSTKHIAFANLQFYDISVLETVLSTSTYTVNGTATVSSQQLSLIVIQNANVFTTASASLSTATYGPFYSGGSFASGGTGTAQLSSPNIYALNTATGSTGYGGVPVPAGSIYYIVSGTDATATSSVELGYQIQPNAALTI